MASSSTSASSDSPSNLQNGAVSVFAKLNSLCTDEASQLIINIVECYLSHSGRKEMTEDLVIDLESIVKSEENDKGLLDNFINAIPDSREYVREELWYKGFGCDSTGHVRAP